MRRISSRGYRPLVVSIRLTPQQVAILRRVYPQTINDQEMATMAFAYLAGGLANFDKIHPIVRADAKYALAEGLELQDLWKRKTEAALQEVGK